MREFLAFPFFMLAKGFAEVASFIDDEPVIIFSLREAVEIDDDNIEDIMKQIDEEENK